MFYEIYATQLLIPKSAFSDEVRWVDEVVRDVSNAGHRADLVRGDAVFFLSSDAGTQ